MRVVDFGTDNSLNLLALFVLASRWKLTEDCICVILHRRFFPFNTEDQMSDQISFMRLVHEDGTPHQLQAGDRIQLRKADGEVHFLNASNERFFIVDSRGNKDFSIVLGNPYHRFTMQMVSVCTGLGNKILSDTNHYIVYQLTDPV